MAELEKLDIHSLILNNRSEDLYGFFGPQRMLLSKVDPLVSMMICESVPQPYLEIGCRSERQIINTNKQKEVKPDVPKVYPCKVMNLYDNYEAISLP